MADLSLVEKEYFENILGMKSGYVLDLNHNEFDGLFKSTLGVDVFDARYALYGNSKAKRLRAFWLLEDNSQVGLILHELLNLWKYQQEKLLETNKLS